MSKEIKEENKLYSTHIFILPFKILEDEEDIQKEKRKERLLSDLTQWKEYEPVESNKSSDKDLMKYLTKYAKDSLFKYGQDKNDKYVMELHNTKIKDAKYIIQVREKKYELKIRNIRIKFFDTSVGTISFELDNYGTSKIEDVLLINNKGRQIYRAYEEEISNKNEVVIKIIGNEIGEIVQDLKEAELEYEKEIEYIRNNIIGYFLNLKEIEPILDDRMYTICQYLSPKDTLEASLKKYWYNYIFIDTDNFKNCQDEIFERELLEKATYRRWRNFGTLYGVSRYSFMLWTNDEEFSKNVLNTHIRNHYFQLVNFVIAQKSTIILLNEKINNILDNVDQEKNEKEDGEKQYQEYLSYLSKLTFKEITCQEQGIELYNLCRKQMSIEDLTEELDIKIKTLNDRRERMKDNEETDNSKKLNNIGMLLAIFGLFFGILGIDGTVIEASNENPNLYLKLINILSHNIVLILAFVSFMLFLIYIYKNEIKKIFKKGV